MAQIIDEDAFAKAKQMYGNWENADCCRDHIREEVLTLFYWLLQAYVGDTREGWEEGKTIREVIIDIAYVLGNRRIDDDVASRGIDAFAKEFCAYWERAYGGKVPY